MTSEEKKIKNQLSYGKKRIPTGFCFMEKLEKIPNKTISACKPKLKNLEIAKILIWNNYFSNKLENYFK